MKPFVKGGLAHHERMNEELHGPDYETQYGQHIGLDAAETLWVMTPHENPGGRGKGDNNRKWSSPEQIDPFFDCVK